MSHASMLEHFGFQKQDLGIMKGYVERFFFLFGETYAVDEDGRVWSKAGKVDPGDLFAFTEDAPTWETPLIDPAFFEKAA